MRLIKMIETSRIKYPMNPWDKASIRPGPVGSVGDETEYARDAVCVR
jgi:hypothetical protein